MQHRQNQTQRRREQEDNTVKSKESSFPHDKHKEYIEDG
jgi:hypothetical protein